MPNHKRVTVGRLVSALKGYTGFGIISPTKRSHRALQKAGYNIRTSSRGKVTISKPRRR